MSGRYKIYDHDKRVVIDATNSKVQALACANIKKHPERGVIFRGAFLPIAHPAFAG